MSTDKSAVQKKAADNSEIVERTRSGKVFIPAVDIYENEDAIMLVADMPGVNEKSIDITLEKDVLCIEGKVDTPEKQDYELVYSEYEVGDYRRSFTLNESVDRDKIEARFNDGVLRLKLPKAEPAKPKRIDVKIN